MNENEPEKEADCGCSPEVKQKRAALDKARAARKVKRRGEEVFRRTVADLACRCRDEFGRCYPCSDGR